MYNQANHYVSRMRKIPKLTNSFFPHIVNTTLAKLHPLSR